MIIGKVESRRRFRFPRAVAIMGLFLTLCCGGVHAEQKVLPVDVGVIQSEEFKGEFDEAFKGIGWKATAYKDNAQGWESLKRGLEKHDLLLGTPGLSQILPQGNDAAAGEKIAVLRTFVEKGGGIVLTGATEPSQLEWLELLDPDMGITAVAPGKKPEKFVIREGNPAHSLRFLPQALTDTGEIEKSYKPSKNGVWENVALWEGGQCTLLKRIGKGFVVVSSLRHRDTSLLENAGIQLRLQRMGLQFVKKEFEFGNEKHASTEAAFATGAGQVRIYARNVSEEPIDLTAVFRMKGEMETREVKRTATDIKPNSMSNLFLPIMADVRGRSEVGVWIVDPSDGFEVQVSHDTVDLPQFLTVVPPAYRGMISTARRDKNVHFKLRFAPLYERIDGNPLKVTVHGPNGKLVSEKEMTVPAAEFPVVMDLSEDAPEGDYTITAVSRRDDAREETAKGTFRIVPVRPGQVFVDQDTVILREGKPFFPLGMYHVSGEQIDEAAEVGFNMFQFWEWDATPQNMDRLAQKNIFAIWEGQAWGTAVYLNPHTIREHPKFQHQLDIMRKAVKDYKNHPALAMWYVADEPSPYHLPSLKAINETWHELDEDHPTYLVATGEYDKLKEACDILAIDVYLVYRGQRNHLSRIAHATDRAMKGVDFRKPVIAVPQSFGNNAQHRETPEDVRCISYLHLTHGVKGLMWYCWKETGDKTGEEGAGHHPETQKVLKEVIQEVNVIAPALMEPGSRMLRSGDGKIHGLICGSDKTGRFLVFVNEDYAPADTTLHVPDLSGKKLEGLFGTAEGEVNDGSLRIKVGAQATGIYKIH